MNGDDNFVDPNYNEGKPDSAGHIVSSYVVEEKDTLPDIARKFGLSVAELVAANRDHVADASSLVQTGTRILIPKKDA